MLVLLAWEAVSTLGALDPLFVSSPSRVGVALVTLLFEASFWEDLRVSAVEFSAGQLQLLRSVVLPGCVPFILTGIRLGVGRGLIGVVVGEFYVSSAGVGHRIAMAGASLQTDVVFAGIVVVTLVGVAMVVVVH